MKRLRISDFQVSLLLLIREGVQCGNGDFHDGCSPSSRNSKLKLYGRGGRFSTTERVTHLRAIRRLIANGMIAPKRPKGGWCVLTDKAHAWLAANESRTDKVELFREASIFEDDGENSFVAYNGEIYSKCAVEWRQWNKGE